MKINVFGRSITVKYVSKVEGGNMGLYDKEKHIIYIDKNLKGDARYVTEWHELGHAFLNRLGWEEVMDDNTQELFCEQLGSLLTELGCRLK